MLLCLGLSLQGMGPRMGEFYKAEKEERGLALGWECWGGGSYVVGNSVQFGGYSDCWEK